jgi:uncharacterized protein
MYKFSCTIFLLLLFAGQALAQLVPEKYLPAKPTATAEFKRVIDDANLLTYGDKKTLENRLRVFEDSTSNQIIVVTVKTLHGYEAYEYATEIGEKWKVGRKKEDNGIVLLICDGTGVDGQTEKKKVFIAVGRGLEGAITDGAAGSIIREQIVPSLKGGQYYSAINNGVSAIQLAAVGEYNIKGTNTSAMSTIPGWVIVLGFLLVFLFIWLASKRMQHTGGMGSRRGYRNFSGPTIFPPYIGGGSGGGGGFFDNNSGGGGGIDIGGFGGGSFGGGGAGGDW